MKDKNKILAGLVVFIAIVTFPFWFNLGKAGFTVHALIHLHRRSPRWKHRRR